MFTYTTANEFNEEWVALDLDVARKLGRHLLRGFRNAYALPISF